jgi:hypothetical protein
MKKTRKEQEKKDGTEKGVVELAIRMVNGFRGRRVGLQSGWVLRGYPKQQSHSQNRNPKWLSSH